MKMGLLTTLSEAKNKLRINGVEEPYIVRLPVRLQRRFMKEISPMLQYQNYSLDSKIIVMGMEIKFE
jgi:hypothetical protein